MEDKAGKVNMNFILKYIKTEQFAIFEENLIEGEPINLSTSLSCGLNAGEKLFISTVKCTFEINEKPFITIQVSCYYELDPTTWAELTDENKLVIPRGFVAQTAMHCAGTIRGILHTKTEDTIFNQFILPPINVDVLAGEDAVFEL